MNKNIRNISLIIITLLFIFFLFYNYHLFSDISLEIGIIYLTKVFPFLFIMMVLNNLLINLNLPYYLSSVIKSPSWYIMILSIMSGSPLNAVILDNFLKDNIVNEKDASIILGFTSFNNPLFLYNYFNIIFHNKEVIIKLFIIIYLTNIILYFIFRKKLNTKHFTIPYRSISFNKAFTDSLKVTINNMLNIFATIFFFYLITSIIIKDNNIISVFGKGLIEITQGLNSLTILDVSLKAKELLTLAILQFQGLSIHMQISAILSKYNINYKYFYLSRIILIILSLGLGMLM